jgi:hypothetical protein
LDRSEVLLATEIDFSIPLISPAVAIIYTQQIEKIVRGCHYQLWRGTLIGRR